MLRTEEQVMNFITDNLQTPIDNNEELQLLELKKITSVCFGITDNDERKTFVISIKRVE